MTVALAFQISGGLANAALAAVSPNSGMRFFFALCALVCGLGIGESLGAG